MTAVCSIAAVAGIAEPTFEYYHTLVESVYLALENMDMYRRNEPNQACKSASKNSA